MDNITSGDFFSELIIVDRDFLELVLYSYFVFLRDCVCAPHLLGISKMHFKFEKSDLSGGNGS